MADIKTCRNTNCEYNENGCYCGSYDVEIDENGACADYRPMVNAAFAKGTDTVIVPVKAPRVEGFRALAGRKKTRRNKNAESL